MRQRVLLRLLRPGRRSFLLGPERSGARRFEGARRGVGWNGAGGEEERPGARPSRRALGIALVANLVVVAVTGLVALALLIAAWRGF